MSERSPCNETVILVLQALKMNEMRQKKGKHTQNGTQKQKDIHNEGTDEIKES